MPQAHPALESVQGNWIGTDLTGSMDLGNGAAGVYVFGTNAINVGGSEAGAGNTIAFNHGDGVFDEFGSVAIQGNSIRANGELGIDLAPDGVTPNDGGDGDEGPNQLQNFPLLFAARTSATHSRIVGTLLSTPNTPFVLQFFSNSSCDPSGNGEAERLVGTRLTHTGPGGVAMFAANFATGLSIGQFVTATAMGPGGNTSELSACVQVTPGQFAEWAVDSDGFWDDPANWIAGAVPGPNDDVIIDRPGVDVTVTFRQGDVTVRSLDSAASFVVSGGSLGLGEDSQITATIDWIGGTIAGAGALNIPPGAMLEINGDADKNLDGATINNSGLVSLKGSGALGLLKSSRLTSITAASQSTSTLGSSGPSIKVASPRPR